MGVGLGGNARQYDQINEYGDKENSSSRLPSPEGHGLSESFIDTPHEARKVYVNSEIPFFAAIALMKLD